MVVKEGNSAQKERSEEQSPYQAFFTEPSLWKPDGRHFTVEGKSLSRLDTLWEPIERGWESPDPFPAR